MTWIKGFSLVLVSFSILLSGIWHLYLEDYQKQRIRQEAERLLVSRDAALTSQEL